MTNADIIVLEHYFPYYDMTYLERNKILKCLLLSKELSTPVLSTNGEKDIKILECEFHKIKNSYQVSGAFLVANVEKRTFTGTVNIVGDSIKIKLEIVRIGVTYTPNVYKITENLILDSSIIKRISKYNFIKDKFEDIIDKKAIKEIDKKLKKIK